MSPSWKRLHYSQMRQIFRSIRSVTLIGLCFSYFAHFCFVSHIQEAFPPNSVKTISSNSSTDQKRKWMNKHLQLWKSRCLLTTSLVNNNGICLFLIDDTCTHILTLGNKAFAMNRGKEVSLESDKCEFESHTTTFCLFVCLLSF